MGLSPDGTWIVGTGTHNGHREAWLAHLDFAGVGSDAATFIYVNPRSNLVGRISIRGTTSRFTSLLILLGQQDRSLWDQRSIQEGLSLGEKAFHLRQLGPYQIQAAISALHASAAKAEETDWRQIAGLYEHLRRFTDTAIIRLNQAVSISMFAGPEQGLLLIEPLAGEMARRVPFTGCAGVRFHGLQRARDRTRDISLVNSEPESRPTPVGVSLGSERRWSPSSETPV